VNSSLNFKPSKLREGPTQRSNIISQKNKIRQPSVVCRMSCHKDKRANAGNLQTRQCSFGYRTALDRKVLLHFFSGFRVILYMPLTVWLGQLMLIVIVNWFLTGAFPELRKATASFSSLSVYLSLCMPLCPAVCLSASTFEDFSNMFRNFKS